MGSRVRHTRQLIVVLVVSLAAACGGAKLIKDPVEAVPSRPLAEVRNGRLAVSLDWVVITNGPGSWAENAYWDEYQLTVTNHASGTLSVTGAVIYDSLGRRLDSDDDRNRLLAASRETAEHYEDEDIQVIAGASGKGLALASGATFAAGSVLGMAVLTGSAAVGAAGVAVGAIAAAPFLALGALAKGTSERRIARELRNRSSELPFRIGPGESRKLDIFFPIAPSPTKLEFAIHHDRGADLVLLDTTELLSGLHLEIPEPQQPESQP